MVETELSPIHSLPSGLCEDSSGEAAALIARLAKADAAALADLHGLWNPVLLGIACQMLGDRREAEKAAQDTWVQLWQRAAGYDPHQTPPFVWAFTVLRDCCANRLRRRAPRPATRAVPHPPSPLEKHDNPRVMAVDDYRRVRAALDHLAPEERSSLVAAVFLQYSQARPPQPEDLPLGTVKNHLRQALTKIRNHLSRYEL